MHLPELLIYIRLQYLHQRQYPLARAQQFTRTHTTRLTFQHSDSAHIPSHHSTTHPLSALLTGREGRLCSSHSGGNDPSFLIQWNETVIQQPIVTAKKREEGLTDEGLILTCFSVTEVFLLIVMTLCFEMVLIREYDKGFREGKLFS